MTFARFHHIFVGLFAGCYWGTAHWGKTPLVGSTVVRNGIGFAVLVGARVLLKKALHVVCSFVFKDEESDLSVGTQKMVRDAILAALISYGVPSLLAYFHN